MQGRPSRRVPCGFRSIVFTENVSNPAPFPLFYFGNDRLSLCKVEQFSVRDRAWPEYFTNSAKTFVYGPYISMFLSRTTAPFLYWRWIFLILYGEIFPPKATLFVAMFDYWSKACADIAYSILNVLRIFCMHRLRSPMCNTRQAQDGFLVV